LPNEDDVLHIDDATVYDNEAAAAASLPVESGRTRLDMAAPCPLCAQQAHQVAWEIRVRQGGARLVKCEPDYDCEAKWGPHPAEAVEFSPAAVEWTAEFEPCGCVWDANVPGSPDVRLQLDRAERVTEHGQTVSEPVVVKAAATRPLMHEDDPALLVYVGSLGPAPVEW
jgi:hypothetical protein